MPVLDQMLSLMICSDIHLLLHIPVPSNQPVNPKDIFVPRLSGVLNGDTVTVALRMSLESYQMQVQVTERSSWAKVDETSESLLLRAHLLEQATQFWVSMSDWDNLSQDAMQILKKANEEITRIRTMSA